MSTYDDASSASALRVNGLVTNRGGSSASSRGRGERQELVRDEGLAEVEGGCEGVASRGVFAGEENEAREVASVGVVDRGGGARVRAHGKAGEGGATVGGDVEAPPGEREVVLSARSVFRARLEPTLELGSALRHARGDRARELETMGEVSRRARLLGGGGDRRVARVVATAGRR